MRILTVRDIPIRLHGSFLLLGGALLAWELLRSGPGAALGSAVLGLLLFGSVLLHELGHALAGRGFGIATRDITLYPFGGVARMQMGALRPLPELVVALAGPAVNLVLVVLGLLLDQAGLPLARELALINLGLGLFNLLPAYPMDGGRVLRAALSLRTDPLEATGQALRLSRWFAWAFIGAAPLLGAWSLALVGAFLLFSIGAEQRRLLHERRLRMAGGLPLRARWAEPAPEQVRRLGFGHPVR